MAQQINTNISDYGCFFIDVDDELKTIFYIKPDLWYKISHLVTYNKKNDELNNLINNLTNDDNYLVRSGANEPTVFITKEMLINMMNDGIDCKNINDDEFVEKYKDKYNYVTNEWINNTKSFLLKEINDIDKMFLRIRSLEKINNGSSCDESCSDINTDTDEE
jgi:hypothetical protein